VFKPMTRAATDRPNVFQIRVLVDSEISIRGVFVLADTEFG